MSTLSVATLSELRTLAQQYADMVNSNFIMPAEWNSYLNLGYFELYDILVQKYGDDYFATNSTITTDGVTFQFALPPNFYKFLGLDLQLGSNPAQPAWITIRPFMFGDRNRYAVPNFQSFYGITNLRYRVFANTLFLTPLPANGQTLRMWYVPRLTELVNDTDTADGVSGWQEYIPICAAIQALIKEESDPSALIMQKQGLIARIESAAAGRDIANPQVVTDSQWSDFGFPSGNGWNGWG